MRFARDSDISPSLRRDATSHYTLIITTQTAITSSGVLQFSEIYTSEISVTVRCATESPFPETLSAELHHLRMNNPSEVPIALGIGYNLRIPHYLALSLVGPDISFPSGRLGTFVDFPCNTSGVGDILR
ncbi:uncharacterized protein Bfra_002242 [Botrytis fragariae]|uniref:Uncharacterized protein n=1 Tax=Botrytis fragariae TaxID=1964551 RepID=A0A8H6AXZ5_9HELO|nr:uncharacterized protein Bfra_002242 [Botrytis fragariae]KAF5875846.1 hypothetical protein Bfra_002242 [Botrytis fragariae]